MDSLVAQRQLLGLYHWVFNNRDLFANQDSYTKEKGRPIDVNQL